VRYCTFLDAKIVDHTLSLNNRPIRLFVAINHQEIKVPHFPRPVLALESRKHCTKKVSTQLLHDMATVVQGQS
jgi:hypothetical protein